MNPDILARYAANRLRVVRQVRYSLHNENCIDLCCSSTACRWRRRELKTDFTQSVDDAIDQYRFDRQPKPEGAGTAEPLLSFPSGALVHFAVSNSEVHMTTRLDGPATTLPAVQPGRRRRGGQSGEPEAAIARPTCGSRSGSGRAGWRSSAATSWRRRDEKKQIEKIIFPRFHQLDATRKLQAAVLEEGPGGKYLIQHSAGSGKTNSIAWTAHFLADLHDAQAQEAVRLGAGGLRPQRDRQPAARSDLRLRAHDRRGRDDQGRGRQQERRAGGGACPAARRSSSAPSRPSPSRWRPCASWRRRRASGSP